MPEDGIKTAESSVGESWRAPPPRVPMPKPGDLFAGRYQVERLLGRGGMGEVYLAVQAPLGRRVAVKILKPPESIEDDPNFDARFLREAAAAARLQHPNTITVYDFGATDDAQLYIVMEYLEGNDIRTVLQHEGLFSPQRAIHVAKQVCKSLREAHAKGIIHRDLKPANVLLIERDEDTDYVKVLDFGLVKFRGEASEITLAGKFLGSPRYTSPEALDRNAEVDHRADVYAVGILLYTMITGTPPFDGDPMQVLNAHLHEKPQPMYRKNPAAETTPELEALIARCLEKEPDARYQSMALLLKALRTVGAYFGDEHTQTLDLDLSEDSMVPDGDGGGGAIAGGLPTPLSPELPPSESDLRALRPPLRDAASLAPTRQGAVRALTDDPSEVAVVATVTTPPPKQSRLLAVVAAAALLLAVLGGVYIGLTTVDGDKAARAGGEGSAASQLDGSGRQGVDSGSSASAGAGGSVELAPSQSVELNDSVSDELPTLSDETDSSESEALGAERPIAEPTTESGASKAVASPSDGRDARPDPAQAASGAEQRPRIEPKAEATKPPEPTPPAAQAEAAKPKKKDGEAKDDDPALPPGYKDNPY